MFFIYRPEWVEAASCKGFSCSTLFSLIASRHYVYVITGLDLNELDSDKKKKLYINTRLELGIYRDNIDIKEYMGQEYATQPATMRS